MANLAEEIYMEVEGRTDEGERGGASGTGIRRATDSGSLTSRDDTR